VKSVIVRFAERLRVGELCSGIAWGNAPENIVIVPENLRTQELNNMRRFAFLLILWVATLCLKAQMTMSFPSVAGVSTKSLTTGTTLVEFPEDVNLSTVMSVANVQLICNSSGAPNSISLNEAKRISKEIYDLQGRRVAVPDKGFYIVGGRKVLIQ